MDGASTLTRKATGSWGALLEAPHALSTAVVVLGILSPAMSAFVTATVLPSVIADIGGLALYAWASTAYAVALILGSAGTSVVVRARGTRGALLVAAAIFVAGTATCASAPGMAVLIGGRTLQGLGGGMLIAAVHGVVREVFPEVLWARMLATISGAWGIAAMAGPAVGGVFAGAGLWRGAFWVMVPFAVVAAAMTWRLLPRATPAAAPTARVPFGRLGLMCASVLCVASVANVGPIGARAALVAIAIAAIALMLRLDRHAAPRLVPSGMLSLAAPGGKGFWIIFFMAASTTPGSVYIPLLLQVLHGLSAATAGYFYAVQALSWTAATLVTARLRGGDVRTAIVLGPLLTAAGFAALVVTIAAGPIAAIVLAVVLVGAGIGTCWAHAGSIVLGSARDDEGAAAGALIPTTQTFAVALGAALSGIIANAAGLTSEASRPIAAVAATWLFAVFLVAPLGAAVIASGARAPSPRGRERSG